MVNVLPDLTSDKTIISSWQLAELGTRQCSDNLTTTPFIASVPENLSLPVDHKKLAHLPTSALVRLPYRSPVYLKSVHPWRYNRLKSFHNGARLNLLETLRHFKNMRRSSRKDHNIISISLDRLLRLRRNMIYSITENQVKQKTAGPINTACIACGLNIESMPNGILSSPKLQDFQIRVFCERDDRLAIPISNRHHAQGMKITRIREIKSILEYTGQPYDQIGLLYLSLSCQGVTVLRLNEASYPTTTDMKMFSDGSQAKLVRRFGKPRCVITECTGPHPSDYSQHKKSEQQYVDMGYYCTVKNKMANAAFHGNWQSRPRYI